MFLWPFASYPLTSKVLRRIDEEEQRDEEKMKQWRNIMRCNTALLRSAGRLQKWARDAATTASPRGRPRVWLAWQRREAGWPDGANNKNLVGGGGDGAIGMEWA